MEKDILERFKKYIDENNLSLTEVAQRLSLSTATVSKWLQEQQGISKRHQRKVNSLINDNHTKNVYVIECNNWPMNKEIMNSIINYLSEENHFTELATLAARAEEFRRENAK
ncbi:MAG: helix-turn-helix transcriptional regulator [Lentisphaerae bacterium]|nr:helix-turn-helix transcriptional regulator [Lentisphaerota bacterium]MCP4102956.1 helix-turn-helix transcriptional regulator [Lentisphaerota bacterium]